MSISWYEWRNIRNRLLNFGRAVQGVSPYRIQLEPDKFKCPSGYTNFSQRLIRVNPTMFDASPEEQYRLTKAVLCHEAGHRRFTTPSQLPSHIHLVSNILEDERIERLMEQEFAGVGWLLQALSRKLLDQAQPLIPEKEDPVEIISYMLQSRWAERANQPVNGCLSPMNQQLWEQVKPLVLQAWSADSSLVCDQNAAEILGILGITQPDIPQWLLDLLEQLEAVEGERTWGDRAEAAEPSTVRGPATDSPGEEPFDGEPVPHEHGAGSADHLIEPQPYLDLVQQVQPLIRRLVEELTLKHSPAIPEAVERGGRLSLRQHLREPDRPFLLPPADPPVPPTLTFRMVIDHSSSMNYDNRIEYAAQAAMLLHLAGEELQIPHQIIVTPDNILLADLDNGERGLALITGMVPAQSEYENTGAAVARHGQELLSQPEDHKLLLVVHDGMGNDHQLLTEECRLLRDRVLILGIGLGLGEPEAELLREQFGPDRYIHCETPADLPTKVGAIIRSVRGA